MGCCGDEPDDVDANIKGIKKDRSCTDVLWLAIFILFWVGMVISEDYNLSLCSASRL